MRAFLIALLGVLAVAYGRVYFEARAALARATAARAAGDDLEAVTQYQYALRGYTPGAAAPRQAAQALLSLSEEAEGRGDAATALMALRRLRGGVRATRWLISPFGDLAEEVDARIAGHMARQSLGQPGAEGRDLEALRAEHLRLLRLDPTPHPGWSSLVTLSFMAWLLGLTLFIRRGLDAEARLKGRAALGWLGFAALSFALWIIGLTQA